MLLYGARWNKCEQCEYGYRLNGERTLCEEIGEGHCSSYSTSDVGTTECKYCQGGYKLNVIKLVN